MTARASITQDVMRRAIRAARAEGAVAVLTPQGVVFAEAGTVALPLPEQVTGSGFDLVDMKK